MKDRPILFSAPLVRAILAGTKTQTRRVVKPWEPRPSAKPQPVPEDVTYLPDFTCYRNTCPYGQPGDRLWVREAWKAHTTFDHLPPREIPQSHVWYLADPGYKAESRTRASMHMPRWASRITLEITSVRVERLQDISDADARDEGTEPRQPVYASGIYIPEQYRLGFRDLWQSINGPESWDANPWVWVVEFNHLKGRQ